MAQEQQSTRQLPEGIIPLNEIPENALEAIHVADLPSVSLYLNLLRSTAPEDVRNQLGVNVRRLAKLAHFGGIDGIRLTSQQTQEDVGIIGGSQEGNALSAEGAQVRRASLEPTLDTREDVLGMIRYSLDHNEVWGTGEIPLDKQTLAQEVGDKGKQGVRDVKVWGKVLNRELVNGVSELSIKHLMSFDKKRSRNFALDVLAVTASTILIALPPYPQPVLLAAAISYVGFNLFDRIKSMIMREPRRFSEFLGNGPEVIRSGMMKSIPVLAKVPVLGRNFQIVVPLPKK